MNILYFHQHFSTPKGATGTRSYEMAKALIKAGHQVTMVCGSFTIGQTGLTGDFIQGMRRGVIEGIDVIELELPYSNNDSFLQRTQVFLKFAWRSILIALREKSDVVFATSTPLTAGIPGIVAKWFRNKPFVFEVRDLWPELPKAMGVITNPVILWMMSVLEWCSYRSADAAIGLSPGIVEGIEKRATKNLPVAMIPNGCDIKLMENIQRNRTEIRQSIKGIDVDDFVAIFTGAHGKANALHNALAAAKVLKEKSISNIKFLFIGAGKHKQELINQAQAQNLDNCLFLDPMPKTELVDYLHASDIGLMLLDNVPAFFYGTSPNKFFDYIAAGLPVLNNYPGWLADMIQEYDIGYAIEPDNPNAFAEALIAAQGNINLKELSNNANLLAKDKFHRHILARQFIQHLENVGKRSKT